MFTLRKTLIVALFVLLSAGLFTAFLPLVHKALIAFYLYQSPVRVVGEQDHGSPRPDGPPANKPQGKPAASNIDTPAPVNQTDTQIDFQPESPTPNPTPEQPFASAAEFFMTSWVSITAGVSLSVTATIFLAFGRIGQRVRAAIRDGR